MWSKTASPSGAPRYLSAASRSGCGGIRTMAKALTMANLNPNIIKLEYAVRGPLVTRSVEIKKELEKGISKPFKRVINVNIGDAHAMGQKPITFVRQVLACVSYPKLIESGKFPTDVQDKARSILASCFGGSVGSYSPSCGIDLIRQHVAEFLQRRDCHPAYWEDIVLTTGASSAIKSSLELFCNVNNGKSTGVMVPVPLYPIYSATLAEYGLEKVDYFLDEDRGWALPCVPEMQRTLDEASSRCTVRVIVAINPGNPTGQILTREDIENIIKFAHKNSLFVLSDEVDQDITHIKDIKFHSFKKVLCDLGKPYSDEVELVSFMSVSKGYMGEGGLRGGWMELVNVDKEVQAQLYKCISAMLCPSVMGQTAVDCLADPPKEGSPSHNQWLQERSAILKSLRERSKMVSETFNKIPGCKSNEIQGAFYAFPSLDLTPKAIEAAKAAKVSPDEFYASRLLEETGICVVPGSGFGQCPNTYHFRITILPQSEMLQEMLDRFKKFHEKFTKEFS